MPMPGCVGDRADGVRRDRAGHPSDVVARALARGAHGRGEELGDEAAEHAEVAVAEVAEHRAEQHEQRHGLRAIWP